MLIVSFGCRDEQKNISIIWDTDKAKGIRIPEHFFHGISRDSIRKYAHVRSLADKDSTNILGEYTISDRILFEPLIPFSRGLTYELIFRDKKIGEFFIPAVDTHDAPQLLACYPKQDTVPENLLKIYLRFSHPMREGQSNKYIRLIKNGTDTLHDVFLDLQPELWNEDRTVITIWLDPGRIKRDLQPNLRLGAPLQEKGKYKLIVSKQWQDAQGVPLQKDFTKSFIVGKRDSLSPDPDRWKILPPKAGSQQPLTIDAGEPLDHFLLMESFRVAGKDGNTIKGKFETDQKDKICSFTPAETWVAGNYALLIESKLEDLAGNNLNRPFDRDITKTKQPSTQTSYRKNFSIEK